MFNLGIAYGAKVGLKLSLAFVIPNTLLKTISKFVCSLCSNFVVPLVGKQKVGVLVTLDSLFKVLRNCPMIYPERITRIFFPVILF